MVMPKWSIYIVRCADGSLYTGITTDLAARIKIHNSGKGAKYTRSRRPVKLMYVEKMKSESAARKREAQIKKFSHAKKFSLINFRRLSHLR
jgi:predicted GIY-YIG superfamily endonuclease